MRVLFDTDVRIEAYTKKSKHAGLLQSLATLCRKGMVEPYYTEESEVEEIRDRYWPRPYGHVDLFENVKFELAVPPFRRSKWGLDGEEQFGPFPVVDSHGRKEKLPKRERNKYVIEFCQILLGLSAERVESFIAGMRKNPVYHLSAFEEKSLRNIQTFRTICRHVDSVHFPDAFHLWTAEENELDVFLTFDTTFRNATKRNVDGLRCEIYTPQEFVERNPLPFNQGST